MCNEDVLKIRETRDIMRTRKRKSKWTGHVSRQDCLKNGAIDCTVEDVEGGDRFE